MEPMGQASNYLKFGGICAAAMLSLVAIAQAQHRPAAAVDNPADNAAIIASLHGTGHPLDEGSAHALVDQDPQGMTCGPDNPTRIQRQANGELIYFTADGHHGNVPDGVALTDFCEGILH